MFLRDLDLPIARHDARCRWSAHLRWCPACCGENFGFPSPGQRSPAPSMCRGGWARQRKQLTYPELSGAFGRARLVVLATEVGVVGRMKPTLSFTSWLRQKRVLSPASRRVVPSRLGTTGGVPRSLVPTSGRCSVLVAFGRRCLVGRPAQTPKVDISRVCVKASPAFGRRHLHTNTDNIVLAQRGLVEEKKKEKKTKKINENRCQNRSLFPGEGGFRSKSLQNRKHFHQNHSHQKPLSSKPLNHFHHKSH